MRIYLAATEDVYRTDPARRVSINVRHLLVSYNGRGGVERYERAITASGPPRAYCVDSGAHFFISAFGKHGARKPLAEAEAHQSGFLDMVSKLASPPAFVVELDLQDLYGQDTVAAWRRDIWIPFQRDTGIPVCFVAHDTEDIETRWRAMLDHPDMRYLGVGGKINQTNNSHGPGVWWPRVAAFARDAYAAGKPLHGFAKVRRPLLRGIPFYSVDSTSWAAGALYGTLHTFDPQHGKMRSHSAGRSAFKTNPAEAAGKMLRARSKVKPADMVGGSSRATGLSSIYQEAANAYREQEEWYTAWWKNKGIDWEEKLGAAGGFYGDFPPTYRA